LIAAEASIPKSRRELSGGGRFAVFAGVPPVVRPETMQGRVFTRNGITGDPLAATLSAAFVAAAGLVVLMSHDLGPRTGQMLLHIAAMNVIAPLVAVLVADRLPSAVASTRTLWLAAAAQLVLLWAWHLPSVEKIASASHGGHAVAHLSLALVALVFWGAVMRASDAGRWHAVAALLVTGKLTCLLSALLVFSPRALYGGTPLEGQFEDQQLAGLLMITACPLSYLVAAVVIVARLVGGPAGVERNGLSG
jgi:putative membrane protein